MWCCRLALVLLAASTGAARAQDLQIAPISVEFQPGQQSAVLTLSNRSDVKEVFQIRPFAWAEVGNAEQLAPTELLAVSPPFAEVAAGQTQTIRLVLRQTATSRETSFRLLIDELPAPGAAGTIRIALRLSIPIFSAPAEQRDPNITGRIFVDGGTAQLVLRNRGARHARLLQASVEPDSGRSTSVQTLASPYLLPGAERAWRIAEATHLRPGGAARGLLMTDQGRIDLVAPISPLR